MRAISSTLSRVLPRAFLLLALLLSPLACKGKADPEAPPKAKAQATQASALVPRPAEAAKGWVPDPQEGSRFRVDGVPKIYDKESIFELLNGGADMLLEAGLITLLHVRLRDDAQVFTDCEIQVMDVTSPAKAKAMLHKEKAPEAKPAKLGEEGFVEATSLLFAKGRHLVRVTALPSGSRKTTPILEVARKVEATAQASW